MQGTIILIGGAPTTGKTTLAKALSRVLGLPWISTDHIRAWMQGLVDREKFPELFNCIGFSAERFLNTFSIEEIVAMERTQGEDVWKGVQAFIETNQNWKEGYIIEGVSILPHLVNTYHPQGIHIKSIFLYDPDPERTRAVVFSRGLWDEAYTYSDTVKEKEVEWASLFSEILIQEAQDYQLPFLAVEKSSRDLQAIRTILSL